MKIKSLAVLALAAGLAGCYHVTVETGKPAGNQVVENEWALSFVAGLIPPETVNVASECSNGVARVESQHSFLNMVVAAVTSSIVTPMTITVTCAAGSGVEEPDATAAVIDAASPEFESLTAALNEAAARSWQRLGAPVFLLNTH